MTRRRRSNQSVERRLDALESDARQEPPAEVCGVTASWVSYDTDDDDAGDSAAAEFVVTDGSTGE